MFQSHHKRRTETEIINTRLKQGNTLQKIMQRHEGPVKCDRGRNLSLPVWGIAIQFAHLKFIVCLDIGRYSSGQKRKKSCSLPIKFQWNLEPQLSQSVTISKPAVLDFHTFPPAQSSPKHLVSTSPEQTAERDSHQADSVKQCFDLFVLRSLFPPQNLLPHCVLPHRRSVGREPYSSKSA